MGFRLDRAWRLRDQGLRVIGDRNHVVLGVMWLEGIYGLGLQDFGK